MDLPSKPEATDNPETSLENPSAPAVSTETTANRDPSYPDRARIDSDVRAFLRPASSPWIVFDRDSRVDDFAKRALRVGAVFASAPSFHPADVLAEQPDFVSSLPPEMPKDEAPPAVVIPAAPLAPPTIEPPSFVGSVLSGSATSAIVPQTNMFPTALSATPSEPPVEPSNLVVATDIREDETSEQRAAIRDGFDSIPEGLVPNRKRSAIIAGGAIGALAIAAAAILMVGARSHIKSASAANAAQTSAAVVAPPAIADIPPPEAVAPSEPAATIEIDPASAPSEPATSSSADKAEKDTKKVRFGKLTIKGEAKHKQVWFDGKRMLGAGQRSFLVFCGMHTIAVSDKADTKDVEVPCNGELAVTK